MPSLRPSVPATLFLLLTLMLSTLGPLGGPQPALAVDDGNPFFANTWQRTDQVVASTEVSRTWVWGPEPVTSERGEPYLDSPGGTRLVRYFDKSRMEINDPGWDPGDIWFVTNGLLARELIEGQMQLGDNTFENRGPAQVNIAGDWDDPDGPTYASFTTLLGDPPLPEGAAVSQTVNRAGGAGCCVPNDHGVRAGPLVSETGHRVASVFWDYLNSSGKIVERGRRTTGPLFANPYYATGLPIGEAYWAQVRVAGVQQWVLVQPFERRVLTYTPGNPAGWQVEMGNVGLHYHIWRYGSGSASAPPSWDLPAYPTWIPAGQTVDIPDLDVRYGLHLSSVNVDTGAVTVQQQISIDSFKGAQPDRLYIQIVAAHFGYFTLDSLTLNGQSVTTVSHHGGFIRELTLPPNLPTPTTIDIDFRLNIGLEPSGWGGTSLDSGILRLGYFFPIISDLHAFSDTLDPSQAQVADFDVTVDVAPDVTVAHAGWEIGRETLGDGRLRYRLTAENVRDFAMLLSRGFGYSERTSPSGVLIKLYIHSSSMAGVSNETVAFRNDVIFAAAVDALEQLGGLIGPYQYDTLVIADSGPTMPAGLEFPSLLYINPAYSQLDRLIYHEVAHQWMHAMIGNRTLVDGWIDEGGAEFFERGLPTGFTERPAIPAGGYRYWLDSHADELVYDASRQWYFSIYEQGARFYYDVLDRMGWDAFWRAFQNLYAEHLFGIVTAHDMLATFQEYSATDLRPLYDDYFRYPWVWELLAPGG
ncbi:MAG TPA: hypothetical protein VMM78_13750 [Thermomicrobiales bacterium]|nr:hypothetical protein [Thermomicrobiales bacterium]